jgi:predicted ArsR family transcriptional regulator
MNQQSRILSAALALETFTVADLAGHSGVPVNTVRSTVDRHNAEGGAQLFVKVGELNRGAPGRRPSIYRLADPRTVRVRLGVVERLGAGPEVDMNDQDRARALVEIAEAALDAAWAAVEDAQREAIASAREAALSALRAAPSAELRACAVTVLSTIQSIETASVIAQMGAQVEEVLRRVDEIEHARDEESFEEGQVTQVDVVLRDEDWAVDEQTADVITLRPLVRINDQRTG